MEKNVGSVDLDELLKARQELNSERGVETDPNMYKDYNPNRKQEEQSQTETEPLDEESVEMINDGEVPFEDTSVDSLEAATDEYENSEAESKPEETGEEPTDFSVYDNFSAFDVTNGGTQSGAGESYSGLVKPTETSQSEEITSSEETSETPVENTETSGSAAINLEDYVVNGEPLQNETPSTASSNEPTPEDLAKAEALLTADEPAETAQENQSGNANDDIQKYLDALSKILDNPSMSEEEGQASEDEQDTAVTEPENAAIVSQETTVEDNDEEDGAFVINSLEDLDNLGQETQDSETLTEEEKLTKTATESDEDSEQKIKDIVSRLEGGKKDGEIQSASKLPTIKDVDFIDIIGSDEFASQENFVHTLGRNEQGSFEFATLKSMYNLAIFSKTENEAFGLVSSSMLSMMLKNSNENLNYYICDAKQKSLFDTFSKSSYLASPIAKTQEDILSLLMSLVSEIDNRYESIAYSGTKNIEEYNKAMAESYIAELPYSILVFGNYHLLEYMGDARRINETINYILKYGRLVGVYAFILSENEISNESINYNLASRISFKTESEEESIKKITVSGAETLAADDEYLLKTINVEETTHLKSPRLSVREIELLIENIEG